MPMRKGVRLQLGEAWSSTHLGAIRRADGTYRRPWVWTRPDGRLTHANMYLVERDCSACGAPTLAASARSPSAYCGSRCRKVGMTKPDGVTKRKRGSDGGHVMVKAAKHPAADRHGFVPEHRLIVERAIGRRLRRGEIVHHVNLRMDDNADANLFLCASSTEHFRIHGSLNRCVADLLALGVLIFDPTEKRYRVTASDAPRPE